jgi:RimJ/RimL family protein N-acetyltransferase
MKLETQRLILRYWQPSDRDSIVAGLNDLSVSKWLAFAPYPYTTRDAEGQKRRAYRCMADGEFKDECITGLLVEEWVK